MCDEIDDVKNDQTDDRMEGLLPGRLLYMVVAIPYLFRQFYHIPLEGPSLGVSIATPPLLQVPHAHLYSFSQGTGFVFPYPGIPLWYLKAPP